MSVANAPKTTPGQTPPTNPPHGPTQTAAHGIQLSRRSLIKLGVLGGLGLALGVGVKSCIEAPELDEINEPDDDAVQSLIAKKAHRLRSNPIEAKSLEASYVRSGSYYAHVVHAFEEAGLPAELADLAFAESRWQYASNSPMGAHGIFQFMPRTARKGHAMGVQGAAFDERRDPIQAAEGAAQFLKRLYKKYDRSGVFPVPDAWYWALTAYNAGEGNIDPYFDEAKGKYRKYFRAPMNKESKEYVAVYFAFRRALKALRSDNDIEQLEPMPALDGMTISYKLTFTEIRVKTGQTLSHIAAAHRVTVGEIVRANRLRRRRGTYLIRVGQRLRIPDPMKRISIGEILDVTGGSLEEFFARNIAANPKHVGRATVLPSGLRVYVPAGMGDDVIDAYAERLAKGSRTELKTYEPS